jgi:hypothetical protein
VAQTRTDTIREPIEVNTRLSEESHRKACDRPAQFTPRRPALYRTESAEKEDQTTINTKTYRLRISAMVIKGIISLALI